MWSKGQLLIFFLFLLVQAVLLYLILLPMLCSSPPLREQRTDKELVGWLVEQQRRKSMVAITCASDLAWMEENWQRSPNNKQGHFLYYQDHNILGCLQPKVRHGLDLCQWVSQQSQSCYILPFLTEILCEMCFRLDQRRGSDTSCHWPTRVREKNWTSLNVACRQVCWHFCICVPWEVFLCWLNHQRILSKGRLDSGREGR